MNRKRLLTILVICVALLVPTYGAVALVSNTKRDVDFSISDNTAKAFSQPLGNITLEEEQKFILGQRLFHNFTSKEKPYELKGIGPRFNAFNCADCHTKDGRGDPDHSPSLVVKLYNSNSASKADPTYGHQLNLFGTDIQNTEVDSSFNSRDSDFEGHLLLGPLDKNTFSFKRIAPETFGLGLIESIPESWFLDNQDPNDTNGDGISGRVNWIENKDGSKSVGRFGWKATMPNIKSQTLHAAFNDLGLENSELNSCTFIEIDCEFFPDLTSNQENNLVSYLQFLAPPKSRPTVESDIGKDVFIKTGCASCHSISAPVENNDITKTKNGRIYPHSDFLLHSMGSKLADPYGFGTIDSDEFRTAPLWGFGLRTTVNGSLNLLHDGRAKTIDEAISFHGGEAAKARERYFILSKQQKQQLENYLNSL